ncbi:carbohydrate ABC transporter permease [Nocardia sp. NBC_01327]|uniref:carbohydrate ABC transporter permease n=1 Tax=Nocardia sp. NBC_01327 TaxID=2903593 RepID=UPI002E153E64|nr:carbohydrate ABC transporter permease [Nocardia sp. NBC_01327]
MTDTSPATITDTSIGARVRTASSHLLLAVTALLCVFPIYWLFATALRRPEDVNSQSPLPWPLSFSSFSTAAHEVDIAGLIANTFFVAILSATGQLLVALLAAYAFAMYTFPLQKLLYLAFVGIWLVPFQVTMLPNFILLTRLGLIDSLIGIVLPTLCSALGVLMMKQHMAAFPKELVAAAKMDGRSSWSILWTVVVPNLRSALAALGILLFINAWNDYFWPAVVLRKSNGVLQLGLRSFMGTEGTQWGPMMAVAGLACLPVLALYLLLQRHIVNAFVRSGLK